MKKPDFGNLGCGWIALSIVSLGFIGLIIVAYAVGVYLGSTQ